MSLARKIRVTVLLYVLLMVAVGAWLAAARSTDWDETLWVTVHPIDGDGREATRRHIDGLGQASFAEIDAFFAEEAEHHTVALSRPVRVNLGGEVSEAPPAPPVGRNPFAVAWWSLRLRWYATFTPDDDGPSPDVRIFVLFHDPQTSPRPSHSLGLRKGLVGVVHAFATRHMAGSNAVVIAHELLHTLGANDRYDPATGLPVFPAGYAEPDVEPLYPQRLAEIMGGRIPLAPDRAETPRSLAEVILGEATAHEIRWLR